MSKQKIIGLVVVITVTVTLLIFEVVTIINTAKKKQITLSQNNLDLTTQHKKNITPTPNSSDSINTTSESDLRRYIPKIQNTWDGYYDFISELPSLKDFSTGLCQISSNKCITFKNETGNWYSINGSRQISTERPFVIRLGLSVTDNFSGVILRSKPPNKEEIGAFLIGYNTNGTQLTIYANSETRPESYLLGSKQIVEPNSINKPGTIYAIIDPKSGKVLVLNQKFEEILLLDTNLITNNAFTKGLFPNKYFRPDILIGNNSSIILTDLKIMPL